MFSPAPGRGVQFLEFATMNGYLKAALITAVTMAVIFRVAPLRAAIVGQ